MREREGYPSWPCEGVKRENGDNLGGLCLWIFRCYTSWEAGGDRYAKVEEIGTN